MKMSWPVEEFPVFKERAQAILDDLTYPKHVKISDDAASMLEILMKMLEEDGFIHKQPPRYERTSTAKLIAVLGLSAERPLTEGRGINPSDVLYALFSVCRVIYNTYALDKYGEFTQRLSKQRSGFF